MSCLPSRAMSKGVPVTMPQIDSISSWGTGASNSLLNRSRTKFAILPSIAQGSALVDGGVGAFLGAGVDLAGAGYAAVLF